jgi:hypothetical protein
MRVVTALVILDFLSIAAIAQEGSRVPSAPSDKPGPFQIIQGTIKGEDTYLLLNNQTGEVWRLTTMTGFKDDPDVWKAMDKLDSCNNKDACELEINRVLSKKYDKKTTDTPPAQKRPPHPRRR